MLQCSVKTSPTFRKVLVTLEQVSFKGGFKSNQAHFFISYFII